MNETRRALLDELASGPVSGPALAHRLGVSRAAVWKQVESLREEGFVVESDDEGYVVADVPAYGAGAVEYGLDAPFTVEYHDAVDSTNDRARALAATGAEDVVVLADEQTGGRGRLDREWASPPGGVWLSVLFRPPVPPAHAPIFTLAAAVATARAAGDAGVDAGIKWPNDVLVTGDGTERKLAGILTEMEGEADRVSWVAIGVGVNANVDADALPATATSLRDQRGADVDRRRFVQVLLDEFDALRNDLDSILPAWREYAVTLGRRVKVDTPGGVVEGEAVDVEFPGSLVVDTGDERVSVHAGDCEHLRPA